MARKNPLNLLFKHSFLKAAFLVAFFVVLATVTYVFAANDNVNCYYGSPNCDTNQSLCVNDSHLTWFTGYYQTGTPNCCGDDSQENYRTCSGGNGASCGGTINACCVNNNDCVFWIEINKARCFTHGTGVNVGDSSSDPEVCSYNGVWIEQDKGGNDSMGGWPYCKHTWLSGNCESGAGPGGVCDDYDSNPSNGYCCGDDASENYRTCSAETGASCNTAIGVCCNTSSDCVYNQSGTNNCYASGVHFDTADSASDEEVCEAGAWKEHDKSSSLCYADKPECTSQYDSANICYKWTTLSCAQGAVSCDDYDANTGNGYCCGDDFGTGWNEAYNTTVKEASIAWSDSTTACCSKNSCVRNSQCKVDIGQGLNSSGNDNIAYCKNISNKMTWSDCDNNLSACGGLDVPAINASSYSDQTFKI